MAFCCWPDLILTKVARGDEEDLQVIPIQFMSGYDSGIQGEVEGDFLQADLKPSLDVTQGVQLALESKNGPGFNGTFNKASGFHGQFLFQPVHGRSLGAEPHL
jgi:hypothetical protein